VTQESAGDLVRDVVVSQLRQGGEQAASGGLARGEEGLGLLEELDPLELVVAAGAAAARGGLLLGEVSGEGALVGDDDGLESIDRSAFINLICDRVTKKRGNATAI
jgi:hypothetical protein